MSTVFARSEQVTARLVRGGRDGARRSAASPPSSPCASPASNKPEYTPHVDTGDHIVSSCREDPRHGRQAPRTRSITGTTARSAASGARRSRRCWPSTRTGDRVRGEGHAAKTRSAAPCSRSCTCSRVPAPARRAAAQAARPVRVHSMPANTITAPAAARPPRRASTCAPAPARSAIQRPDDSKILRP